MEQKIMTNSEDPKKFPFSEAELLENIDEYNAHADELAVLQEAEYCIATKILDTYNHLLIKLGPVIN